ncbi:uncharacterized protein LOC126379606 [Pectinophora gossypiella]|uniref:uncharacterized protein LOC126379606 n=1 Tax=Pectinophora gossypiella TaxID=13191 RepID=UPI00214E0849|nr:uncharacterized protein LOC126379606 [Pectinophora gossypiella]
MRLLNILIVFSLIYCVYGAKGNIKSLTESFGQEIIEIGPPVKGLPPNVDEEPSAEVDDDDVPVSTLAPSPGTKKEVRKLESRYKSKDPDTDEDEIKIERELAEIYKDTTDYKDTLDVDKKGNKPSNTSSSVNKTIPEKPIGRAKMNFKFQPDLDNRKEIEKFRTSVDEISCDRAATKRLQDDEGEKSLPDAAFKMCADAVLLIITVLITST